MVTNVPNDMDLDLLRENMKSYGSIVRWAVVPGNVQVYAVYQTPAMAHAAIAGLREHRRLIVTPVSL